MNTLKKILLGLGVLLTLFFAIGFLLPSHIEVQRSLMIKATPQQIHPFVENLKLWSLWAPWGKELDPTIVYTYSGAEKGEAAQMVWTAKKMGSGTLSITRSEPNIGIWYTISFNHGNMLSQGSIVYEPVQNGTLVTWKDKFDLGGNPINRYFGLLMDSMIGADFNKGLAKLKQVVENSAVEHHQSP